MTIMSLGVVDAGAALPLLAGGVVVAVLAGATSVFPLLHAAAAVMTRPTGRILKAFLMETPWIEQK
jgi:hypothetical protein